MAAGVIIRRAGPADASLIAPLAERTFRETFARDNSAEDMNAYVAATFGSERQLAELSDPRVTVLVAESDDDMIGYAQLISGPPPSESIASPTVELQRFYLDRKYHGTGTAQLLMREVLALASAANYASVWLGVWELNVRAIAFYRKFGFEDVGSHSFMLGSDAQTDRIMCRSTTG